MKQSEKLLEIVKAVKATRKEEARLMSIVDELVKINETLISGLENEAAVCVKKMFPQMTQDDVDNWIMDVLYNCDAKATIKRMEKIYKTK